MNKTEMLNQNRQFRFLYRKGSSFAGGYCVLYYRKNKLGVNRIGFTVSKKLGNAVHRNRARRLLKESYRLLEPELSAGYDLVVVGRTRLVTAHCKEARASLRQLLLKAHILEEGKSSETNRHLAD